MISSHIIQNVTARLVDTYEPLEIYLFGSYAWGTPDNESDLDLLVVVAQSAEKKWYRRSIPAAYALKDLMIPKDVLVLTKEEFEKGVFDKTTLLYKIKHEGRRLYAQA